MFEHGTFSSFHRLKPEENEDFEKHYFEKIYTKSFDKINTVLHHIPKCIPVFEKMQYYHIPG